VANRTPLEQQTGADLIYYNATFRSFVLVQYKVMEKEPGNREAAFRFPNKQLTAELSRMDGILAMLANASPPTHRDHFRLHVNPFFLKLCPRIILEPDSMALTKGMYLPLEYWRFVDGDPDLVGKRGGRIVTFENIRRYFDNSSFANMVREAWIGATPQQTAILGPIVEQILKEGRAVVVAVKADKADLAA
jgi:hypothetical protein